MRHYKSNTRVFFAIVFLGWLTLFPPRRVSAQNATEPVAAGNPTPPGVTTNDVGNAGNNAAKEGQLQIRKKKRVLFHVPVAYQFTRQSETAWDNQLPEGASYWQSLSTGMALSLVANPDFLILFQAAAGSLIRTDYGEYRLPEYEQAQYLGEVAVLHQWDNRLGFGFGFSWTHFGSRNRGRWTEPYSSENHIYASIHGIYWAGRDLRQLARPTNAPNANKSSNTEWPTWQPFFTADFKLNLNPGHFHPNNWTQSGAWELRLGTGVWTSWQDW